MLGIAMVPDASSGRTVQALSPRLREAAHEFEGQMMKELLKPMTRGDSLFGEDEDGVDGAAGMGALGEFGSEALAQALSRSGGFGIADRILSELSHSERAAGTSGASQKNHPKFRNKG